MNKLKQRLLLTLLSLCSMASFAYDFEVDGVYYNVVDLQSRTVAVTHSNLIKGTFRDPNSGYSYSSYRSYSGEVIIPETVVYKGKEFTVTSIEGFAFINEDGIQSISIPKTVTSIDFAVVNQMYGKYLEPFYGCNMLSKIAVGYAYNLNRFSYMNSQITSITLLDNFVGTITQDFSAFDNLEQIITQSSVPPTFGEGKHFSAKQYMDLPVYVPEEKLGDYQNSNVWKDFWELNAMKKISSIAVFPTSVEMEPDETQQLSVTILPESAFNKTVVWKSSDSNVASISENGVITGHGKGNAVITASTIDGSNLSADCKVHVDCLAKSIKISQKEAILEPEQTISLSATISPSNVFVKDVNWKTLDSKVAVVDEYGKVTAKSEGRTKIIVSTTDGTELTDTCEVMVMNMGLIENNGLFYKVGTDGAVVVENPNGSKYSGAVAIPGSITIQESIKIKVCSIASGAFKDSKELTKISIPESVTTIGDGAFSGCTGLKFIRIENGSTLNVNVDKLFADSDVEELYLGSDYVTFNNSSKLLGGLKSIVIGNSVTKLPNAAVCNKNLERFIVEDGESEILEPSDYCTKSYKQTYNYTIKSGNVYYRFGYLVTILHLKPLADLLENKSIKYIYFGRDLKEVVVDKPQKEEKPTSAGSRYQEYGYVDEYNYQYQEYVAKTDYKETSLSNILLNYSEEVLGVGEEIQLSVTNVPSSVPATDVLKWSSSNESVAVVDVFGKVTMVGQGEVIITVQTLDGTNLSASCVITSTNLNELTRPSNAYCLVLEKKDGSSEKYVLADRPEIKISDDAVVISSDKVQTDCPIEDFLRFYFEENQADDISCNTTSEFVFKYNNEMVYISGVERMELYTTDGMKLCEQSAVNGEIRMNISSLTSGLYVIKTDKKTVKIKK